MTLYKDLSCKLDRQLSVNQLNIISKDNPLFNTIDIKDYYCALVEFISRRINAKTEISIKDDEKLSNSNNIFVISITGSVASGKTSMAKLIASILENLPNHPKVDIVSTDCFLFPTKTLTERNLMKQKGFPISYDWNAMITFLRDLHAGKKEFKLPIYSHETYDILNNSYTYISNPQIIIVEGLNLLQLNSSHNYIPSDFIDFSIYIDVSKNLLEDWFLHRISSLRHKGEGFYAKLVNLSEEEANIRATKIWKEINLPNLEQFIEPTKVRANMIITKGLNHRIEKISIRN